MFYPHYLCVLSFISDCGSPRPTRRVRLWPNKPVSNWTEMWSELAWGVICTPHDSPSPRSEALKISCRGQIRGRLWLWTNQFRTGLRCDPKWTETLDWCVIRVSHDGPLPRSEVLENPSREQSWRTVDNEGCGKGWDMIELVREVRLWLTDRTLFISQRYCTVEVYACSWATTCSPPYTMYTQKYTLTYTYTDGLHTLTLTRRPCCQDLC